MKILQRIRLGFIIVFFLSSFILCSGKHLEIISFNDFNGSLVEDTSPKGLNPGAGKLVTFIKETEKKRDGNVIVVSAGDNFRGTALSRLTEGKPVIEIMNELKVSASAIGNQEFDWGIDQFTVWKLHAKFPFLAANVINKKTLKTSDWAKPYVVVEKGGKNIAFIGLTTMETTYKTSVNILDNVEFVDTAFVLKKWINYLKNGKNKDKKPDVIIALTHIASFQNDETGKITGDELIRICQVKGLDAVILGYDDTKVAGLVNGIPVVQGGSNGRDLGILDMEFADENGKLKKITPSVVSVPKANIIPDKEALEIINKYQQELKKFDKVLGEASDEIYHDHKSKGITPLGVFVARSINECFHTQVAMIHAGGLRDSLHKGKINFLRMYEIVPFDNEIIVMKIKGVDIKRIIESKLYSPNTEEGNIQFYGLMVVFDPSAPYKNRITSISLINGEKLKMDEYYSVAVVDFMYHGGDKYDFSGAKDVKNTGVLLRDVITDTIEKEKEISPMKTDYLVKKIGE